jgi:hypothetical protein
LEKGLAATLPSLLLAAGLLALTPGSPRAEVPVRPPLSLQLGHDGVYRIEGRFTTSATSAAVWSVLTDYSRIPSFSSSVAVSRWHLREGARPLLEQQAQVRVLFFSRRMTVHLDVEEESGQAIRFTDVSGRDFTTYHGSWTLEPQGNQVLVIYRLDAQPRGHIPVFVARAAMRGSAQRMIEEVQAEITRYAATLGGGGAAGVMDVSGPALP